MQTIPDVNIGIPPDVEGVTTHDGRDADSVNDMNDRLKWHGWVLLGIFYTREVEKDGSFQDYPTYIVGYKRKSGVD